MEHVRSEDAARAASIRSGALPDADYSTRTGATIGLLSPDLASGRGDPASLRAFFAENGERLRADLVRHGATLLRGFDVDTIADFDSLWSGAFVPRLQHRFMWAEYGRKKVGTHAVNSNYTRVHATLGILRFHHENLHLPRTEAPDWVAFGCIEAPARGGETAIVDTAGAFDDLPTALQEKLLAFPQRYELRIPRAMWPAELGTADRDAALAACEAQGFRVVHGGAKQIVVSFSRPCVETHPITGRRSIHLDRSTYGVTREFWSRFRDLYGEKWPSFRVWQALSVPGEAMVAGHRLYRSTIRRQWVALDRRERAALSTACAAHVAAAPYHRGDVLLVDNVLAEHTALPWDGDRRIVVAMGSYADRGARLT